MEIKTKINLVLVFLCIVSQNAHILAQCDTTTNNCDTTSVYNSCSNLTLYKDGDTLTTAFYTKFWLREYSFQTFYFKGRPANLMIYYCGRKGNRLVAEFANDWWRKNEWFRYDYHVRSVPYRKQLLKKYLKTSGYIQYEQIKIIDKE